MKNIHRILLLGIFLSTFPLMTHSSGQMLQKTYKSVTSSLSNFWSKISNLFSSERNRKIVVAGILATGTLPTIQPSTTTAIPEQHLFQAIMGVDETTFRAQLPQKPGATCAQYANYCDALEQRNGIFYIKDLKNNKEYQAGTFSIETIEKLRAQTKEFEKENSGSFNLIIGNRPDTVQLVDIYQMQADQSYAGGTFQIASNFHALENVNKDHYPTLTEYLYDRTQGPAASLSALPGTILRQYYAFISGQSDPYYWPQAMSELDSHNGRKQINLMEKVARYYPVINGYVLFTNAQAQLLPNLLPEQDIIKNIEVCNHQLVQVIYAKRVNGTLSLIPAEKLQIINQVFTAAIDLAGTNKQWTTNANIVNLANYTLSAAYEGTIRSAMLNAHHPKNNGTGKNKLVLTLIGGGVFGNKLMDIVKAITQLKDLIKKSSLEITLVIYDIKGFYGQAALPAAKRLKDFATNMGGKIFYHGPEQYKQDWQQ